MNAELITLPNLNLKVIKPTIKQLDDFILIPYFNISSNEFNFINFIVNYNLKPEEADILILIFHLYITRKKPDNLLYFNTDDILMLRGVKKNKSCKNGKTGYKKEVRKRIKNAVINLSKLKIFTVVDYNNFNFVLDIQEIYSENIQKVSKINRNIFTLNPFTKSWHKRIGLFLHFIKYKKELCIFNIQIKKIFGILPETSLPPYLVREKFENVMDELNKMNLIKGWHYINIDETSLDVKNWIYFWKNLSIKIYF